MLNDFLFCGGFRMARSCDVYNSRTVLCSSRIGSRIVCVFIVCDDRGEGRVDSNRTEGATVGRSPMQMHRSWPSSFLSVLVALRPLTSVLVRLRAARLSEYLLLGSILYRCGVLKSSVAWLILSCWCWRWFCVVVVGAVLLFLPPSPPLRRWW